MTVATIHLRPSTPLAPRALLPGDPGRALALAQLLIEQPQMTNHNRGLWGYTGPARSDGAPLTVQSTGMGGPSAAIVLHELALHGVTRAVRVGTCGSFGGTRPLGSLLVAGEAIAADGASRALGAGERAAADATLTAALELAAAARACTVVSTDLFYDPDETRNPGWAQAGAAAVEMEAATLFAAGARAAVAVGCVLVVSDLLWHDGTRERIDDELLTGAAATMGAVAVQALS